MGTYHNPERQCYGKQRFVNKRAAKGHAKRVEQVFGARLRAYHCPWCEWYHLGNPPPGRRSMSADSFTENEDSFTLHIDNPNEVG